MGVREQLFTRRQIVKALLTIGVTGVAARYAACFANDGTSVSVLQSGAGHPAFEQFEMLSRLTTLHDDLDAAMGRRIYAVLMDEPWGPDHISRCYAKLNTALKGAKPREPLTEGEAWFVSHLITTWYLGVYYHSERKTQRVGHETALMWRAVQGKVPILYRGTVSRGDWSRAPKNIHG